MHSEPYSRARIQKILRCPDCKSTALEFHDKGMTCTGCHQEFATWKNGYVLIGKESPVRQWYPVSGDRPVPRNNPPFLKRVYKWLRPPDRVWTNQSIAVLKQVLNSRLKDLQEGKGMITGAGFERMYRKVLKGYPPLLRYGLTTKGRIDIHGDLCDIPLQDRSLRVIISSSVLEHVYNPERAVAELYRVLEPGGEVYVEIPFIRGFHLIPVDYQRYTIAGIEELFRRHGFQIIEKGISSGPVNAIILMLLDLLKGILTPVPVLGGFTVLGLSLLSHPFKYIDKWIGNRTFAQRIALNFYYRGKKG